MANNRMIVLCNKCFPTDDWKFGDDVLYMAKWYPIGAYYTNGTEADKGKEFFEYLERHAHSPGEDGEPHQENPVRLTYEIWVRDMPAIKKWEYGE